MTRDPMRFSDPSSSASPVLRALLDSVSVDEPGAAQIEKIAAGLGMAPPPPVLDLGAGSVVTTPAAVSTGGGIAAKLLLLGGIIGAGVGGAWWGHERINAVGDQVAVPSVVVREEPVRPEFPSVSLEQSVEAPPAMDPVVPARSPRVTRVVGGPTEVPIEAPVAIGTTVGDVTTSELAIIKRARDVLTSEPARALDTTDAHLTRYPTGRFSEEREAVAIEALTRLQRWDEARARLERFLSAYPRSSYRARLERLARTAR